jgi:serine/threonine protein kinase/class 3 adenylate cyclase
MTVSNDNPAAGTGSGAVLRVFLFTDLVGSTDLKERVGDIVASQRIAAHDDVFRAELERFGGVEQVNSGDAFFATFDLPSDAMRCALAFVDGLSKLDGAESLQVRVGIHMGETSRVDGTRSGTQKLVGLAVDTAARVMGLAQPGQILMTRHVFDSVRQHVGEAGDGSKLQWLAHGRYRFKGVGESMEIFEAGVEGMSPLTPPPDSEKAKRSVAPGEETVLGWRPAAGLSIPGRSGWVLEDQLGIGAFGESWTARHDRTHDLRAFKFCHDAEHLRGLERELTLFRLMKKTLGERRDIAKLYEVNLDAAPFFLEMEYTSAGNLVQWSESRGGLLAVPMRTRLKLVGEIAEALAAAHSVGIVHEAIGPSSVLIHSTKGGEPEARLTDFGIGHLINRDALEAAGITQAGFDGGQTTRDGSSACLGARLYMAPELVAGGEPTILTDTYALGVLLFQMTIGDFERPLGPCWDDEVSDATMRKEIAACVTGDPADRVADAKVLAERLRSIVGGDGDLDAADRDVPKSGSDATTAASAAPRGTNRRDISRTAQTPPPSPQKHTRGWPQLSEYEILRKIGQGGMGVVYEAIKLSTESKCAIKILPPGAHWSDADERFRKEAKAAARLNHTNIVRVTELKQEGKYHYYEMELVEGWAVNDLIDEFSSANAHELPAGKVLEISRVDPARLDPRYRESNGHSGYYRLVAYWLKGVADALEYAHAQKVWHRDIKPHNLLLGHDGRMMVTDFGLAKVLGGSANTLPGTRRDGSPGYMSPEQVGVGDGEVDHRVDIYALGVTLYELLSYQHAFQGKTSQEILSQVIASVPASPRELVPTVPSGLEAICFRAMAKKRDDRYHSAGEMRDALQAWLDAETGDADDSLTRPTDRHRVATRKRSFAPLLVGAVIAIAAVVFGLMGLLKDTPVVQGKSDIDEVAAFVSTDENTNSAVSDPLNSEDVPSRTGPPPVVYEPETKAPDVPPQVRRGRIVFAILEDRNAQDGRYRTNYGGYWQQKLLDMFEGDAAWEVVPLNDTGVRESLDALREDAMAAGADILVCGTVVAEIVGRDRAYAKVGGDPTVSWQLDWTIDVFDAGGKIMPSIAGSHSEWYRAGANQVPRDLVRTEAGKTVERLKEKLAERVYHEGQ